MNDSPEAPLGHGNAAACRALWARVLPRSKVQSGVTQVQCGLDTAALEES